MAKKAHSSHDKGQFLDVLVYVTPLSDQIEFHKVNRAGINFLESPQSFKNGKVLSRFFSEKIFQFFFLFSHEFLNPFIFENITVFLYLNFSENSVK